MINAALSEGKQSEPNPNPIIQRKGDSKCDWGLAHQTDRYEFWENQKVGKEVRASQEPIDFQELLKNWG